MTPPEVASPRDTDWARVALLWLCGMGAGLQFAKASVAFDSLAAYYQAGPALAGWMLSAVGAVGVVFGATAGLIVGRVGLRRSLVAALFCAAILSLVQAMLPPIWLFLSTRVLEGAAHLAIIVAAPICLPGLTALRHRAIILAFWGTFFSAAFLVAGAVGGWLIDDFGLSGLFVAHAGVMGALALAAFALVHPAETREAAGAPFGSFSAALRQHVDIYANPNTSIPALCFFCYTSMFLALQTLTPALAAIADRRWLIVGMPLVSIASTLCAGAIVQYWLSPFRLAAWAFLAIILSTMLLHLAVGLGFAVLPAGLARMAFVSLLPGAVYPMIPLLCIGLSVQARAYGAIAQLGNVGSVLGPPIFAAGLSAFGSIGLMAPTLALSACGILLTSLASRRFAGDSNVTSPQRV